MPERPKPKPVGKLGIGVAVLFLGFLLYAMGHSSSTSRDPAAPRPEDNPGVRADAQRAIGLAGYTCDSISFMGQLVTKTGFRVTCNGNRYAYTITDEGGRIVVRLD
jgi:hypothetical protein